MRTIPVLVGLLATVLSAGRASASGARHLAIALDAPPGYLLEAALPPDTFGPGSQLFTRIPDGGTIGCTANFLWRDQHGKLYLGTAGHCLLPGADSSFDIDTSAFEVSVGVPGGRLALGRIAYTRQSDGDGYDVGNDFGIIEIPDALRGQARARMPVWDGPYGIGVAEYGEQTVHYGFGLAFGTTPPTRARVGMALSGSRTIDETCARTGACTTYRRTDRFGASGPAIFGDSGSAVNLLAAGRPVALGILTHGLPGYYNGTTIARAKQMALEAGLHIEPLLVSDAI